MKRSSENANNCNKATIFMGLERCFSTMWKSDVFLRSRKNWCNLPFDEFCILSQDIQKIPYLPTWNEYFLTCNIKPVFLDSASTNIQKLSYLRLYFKSNVTFEDAWYDKVKIKQLGWLPLELKPPKLGDLNHDTIIKLINDNLLQQGYIRFPYYITMIEILQKNYTNLFMYLIKKYFTNVNISEISIMRNTSLIRELFSTKKVYIIYKEHRIASISQCIRNKDIQSTIYLLKKIGLKPTQEETELINAAFPSLGNVLFLIT